jgi:hypothetical protein
VTFFCFCSFDSQHNAPVMMKEPQSLQVVETLGGKAIPKPDNGRMLILRTFCPFDIDKVSFLHFSVLYLTRRKFKFYNNNKKHL